MLVAAFRGWNDAGDAATAAAEFIEDRFDHVEVACIDPDEFLDFTSVRPDVKLTDGELARSSGPRPGSPRQRCLAPTATWSY